MNLKLLKRVILLIGIVLFIVNGLIAQTNPRHVWVKGHWRGSTWVDGYYRTSPNHTNVDNFSTIGNTNPYTGQKGWVEPDGHQNPWKEEVSEDLLYEVQPYYSNTPTISTPSSSPNYSNSTNTDRIDLAKNITKEIRYSKSDQVNVRSAPGTNSQIEFRINKGDEVEILQRTNSQNVVSGYGSDYWYKIRYQSREGWVFGALIGTRDYNTTMPDEWDGEFLTIKGNNVNVRAEPSVEEGKVKFQLNIDDRVEIIAKTTDKYSVSGYGEDYWYYIKYDDLYGWVFGKLTRFND